MKQFIYEIKRACEGSWERGNSSQEMMGELLVVVCAVVSSEYEKFSVDAKELSNGKPEEWLRNQLEGTVEVGKALYPDLWKNFEGGV